MKTSDIIATHEPVPFMSDDLLDQLRKRIIARRKAAGLTQAEVAERLGLKLARYGHYERGLRRVPLTLLPDLAQALECEEGDLLGIAATKASKRGPSSRAERLVQRLGTLPRKKQSVILDMVEGAIDKAS
ncbi:helix-turn-helix domain-containing protein [Puniceicoccus vermicola]|uniref:Helix-turn-helix transcriptional regulator n=1 Tax=Puniceicoccus vermicola TaxID=388746 RepID=A0A7X1E3H8_9BACT|nr:helix-turn-helix transcriptional regulator [Puniceicoccus vermicola]MBC2600989.1 helix-turn-helix transcriptional regulator [Puniceicoccus vermicola]MBC2600994.1 helix-turn-helix transcriptional regulator [Puniceicoccus vermicola]MBC2601002.1 helix-turn-helix transcriptional regulator [Puniceicoccus vermicola]